MATFGQGISVTSSGTGVPLTTSGPGGSTIFSTASNGYGTLYIYSVVTTAGGIIRVNGIDFLAVSTTAANGNPTYTIHIGSSSSVSFAASGSISVYCSWVAFGNT